MPSCFETPFPSKTTTYSSKGIKPCVSAPSCSAHKHRPRPAPCPDPDKCYQKCIKKKQKCASAMEIVTRGGSACSCSKFQYFNTRRAKYARMRGSAAKHRTRIRKAYARRSMISRWDVVNPCCKCCKSCRNIGCCKCCKCCEPCCRCCFRGHCTIL